MTLWFPARYRARVMGTFLCAAPISLSLGGPVSGVLLELDGTLGIPGWRWMFFLEALPAIVLSFVVLRYLTDRPPRRNLAISSRETSVGCTSGRGCRRLPSFAP
ncbi:MFS transporter [Pseudomonas lini]